MEKKGVAVKESLITAVSNDADMITRRLIEATPQLDGEKVGCRWNHILKENHTVPTYLCPFGCDRRSSRSCVWRQGGLKL